jgi:sugar phosphate isomerase/epimerase
MMIHGPRSIVINGLFPDTVHDPDRFAEAAEKVAQSSVYDTVEFYFEGALRDEEKVREALAAHGFRSVFLAGYRLKKDQLRLGDLDRKAREEAVAAVRTLIDRAYFYGSRKMLILSGARYSDPAQNERSLRHLEESLVELCRYAEQMAGEYVLGLTFEHFNDRGEPHFLVGTSEAMLWLAQRVSSVCGNFEVTFDLSHALQLGEDPERSLEMLAPHVKHIHLANCVIRDPGSPFYGDRHPPLGWEGGEVDLERARRFLSRARNLGLLDPSRGTVVGVEILTPPHVDAWSLYSETTQAFRSLFD